MNKKENEICPFEGQINKNLLIEKEKNEPPLPTKQYENIIKKAPLIKSKNTRYYFDAYSDFPTKIRIFDPKKNEFYYTFSKSQGDILYENELNLD